MLSQLYFIKNQIKRLIISHETLMRLSGSCSMVTTWFTGIKMKEKNSIKIKHFINKHKNTKFNIVFM